MFLPLLEVCPEFGPQWRQFQASYADSADPPLYIALGELAEYLIDRQRSGDTRGFEEIFAVVERWHTEGDAQVSEAATVGFLESLQNLTGGNDRTAGFERVKSSDFESYLGPETRKWWDKLYRFWDGDGTALQYDT